MRRLARGCAACVWLAGCVTPAPYDGLIPVDEAGLAQRLMVLCHLGIGDETARAACAAPPPQDAGQAAVSSEPADAEAPLTVSSR